MADALLTIRRLRAYHCVLQEKDPQFYEHMLARTIRRLPPSEAQLAYAEGLVSTLKRHANNFVPETS